MASAGAKAGAALLETVRVEKRYGQVVAVAPTDLAVAAGDFLAILGPSGCGKSTLLRMVAGFARPSAGRILIEGRDVTSDGPERRPTNMVFQNYGLFPHMSLRENVAFGPTVARLPAAEVRRRVDAMLDLVQLGALADRPVERLSGGQRQRVALARALVMRPKVLLLDEPLSALDLKLRQAMQEELRRLHQAIGGTFIVVTHDQGEAMSLANRIAVMAAGRVVQEGSPADIYQRPRTAFVAGFVGDANLLPGLRAGGRLRLAAGPEVDAPGPDGPATLLLRPEALRLGGGHDVELTATLVDVVLLGPVLRLTLRLPGGQALLLHRHATGAPIGAELGDTVAVGWASTDAWMLEAEA